MALLGEHTGAGAGVVGAGASIVGAVVSAAGTVASARIAGAGTKEVDAGADDLGQWGTEEATVMAMIRLMQIIRPMIPIQKSKRRHIQGEVDAPTPRTLIHDLPVQQPCV